MGEYCKDDTIIVHRHVKVLHLVLTPSSGDILMVQYYIGTRPLDHRAMNVNDD